MEFKKDYITLQLIPKYLINNKKLFILKNNSNLSSKTQNAPIVTQCYDYVLHHFIPDFMFIFDIVLL